MAARTTTSAAAGSPQLVMAPSRRRRRRRYAAVFAAGVRCAGGSHLEALEYAGVWLQAWQPFVPSSSPLRAEAEPFFPQGEEEDAESVASTSEASTSMATTSTDVATELAASEPRTQAATDVPTQAESALFDAGEWLPLALLVPQVIGTKAVPCTRRPIAKSYTGSSVVSPESWLDMTSRIAQFWEQMQQPELRLEDIDLSKLLAVVDLEE